jgi:cytoskeletal protein CcmA (bactofilin family)
MSWDHLDEITAVRYLDGELEETRQSAMAAHLEACPQCRSYLEGLERETSLLREAFIEADEPGPGLGGARAAEELSWAIIGLAAMAAGGVYWLWGSLVVPWWERLESVGLGGSTLLTTLFFRSVLWKGWSDMGDWAFEALRPLALLVAAVTVGLVFRWAWRHSRPAAVLLAALLALELGPGSVEAAQIQKGRETYTLEANEVVSNDLIVAARTVRIEGTIDGDLIVVAKNVTVSGQVNGDVLALCQSLRVTGTVQGSVRNLSESVEIAGQVERNVTALCESVDLERQGRIAGGLVAGAESVKTDGQVGRDLMAAAARHEIRGSVEGSALLGGGRLEILPGARIEGQARFYGDRQPEVSSEAKLASPLEAHVDPARARSKYARPGFYWEQALGWAAAFLFGAVLVWLLPQFFSEVVRSLGRWGTALGFGVLTTFATPLTAALVAITLVGLAVGLTALFLYVVALYAAQVFVGAWLGVRLLGEARAAGEWLQRLAIGLLAVRVASLIPVAGTLVSIGVVFLGVGGLAVAFYQRVRPAPLPASSA